MNNLTIFDSFAKAKSVISDHQNISVSVSGGADSDIVMDLVERCKDGLVGYVWFDTGLEYQATKDHLKYLEEKYGVMIKKVKAVKPIPSACKEFGQPFMSKFVSEMISRLQKYNFKWEDRSFEELYKEYPKCKSALLWWTNTSAIGSDNPRFGIHKNKWLKEFMVENPPTFKISGKCCEYAKKKPVHNFIKENNITLNITGIRQNEGGIRAVAYKNCFDTKGDVANYRPIFWYTNDDQQEYEREFNVEHSKCYTEYGLKRTGCAGCPFGKNFEKELEIIAEHEPKLLKAVNNIFGDSYEYTRKYLEFKRKKEEEID